MRLGLVIRISLTQEDGCKVLVGVRRAHSSLIESCDISISKVACGPEYVMLGNSVLKGKHPLHVLSREDRLAVPFALIDYLHTVEDIDVGLLGDLVCIRHVLLG